MCDVCRLKPLGVLRPISCMQRRLRQRLLRLKQARLQAIPGMVPPNQVNDDMADA